MAVTDYLFKPIVLLLLTIPLMVNGQDLNRDVQVSYISAGHVYLDAGEQDGIAVGDSARVIRGKDQIALIEVIYVAGHSASCKILEQTAEIQYGDRVVISTLRKRTGKQDIKQPVKRDAIQQKRKTGSRSEDYLKGSIRVQWYQIQNEKTGFSYREPGLKLNLRTHSLFSEHIMLRMRSRIRYLDRNYQYSSRALEDEWRNRMYEISVTYENDDAPLQFSLGRLSSRYLGGTGYLDGALVSYRASEYFSWGVFAGLQPQWRYSGPQLSLQKYGAFCSFDYSFLSDWKGSAIVSAAGEYHGSTVSRELLFAQWNLSKGKRLSFYNSLELDLNRGWKYDKLNAYLALSRIYLNVRYVFTDWLSSDLNYSKSKNYYTYEFRNVADSLFDTAFRDYLRIGFSLNLFRNFRFRTSAGVRQIENFNISTYSYMNSLNISNLIFMRSYINLQANGFSGFYSDGFNPSITIGKYFKAGHSLSTAYGFYMYTMDSSGDSFKTEWYRGNLSVALPLNLSAGSTIEYRIDRNSADTRFFFDLGYRL